jgi:hypothetical protein
VSDPDKRSSWYIWATGVAILGVIAWFFTPLPAFFGAFVYMSKVRKAESRLQDPKVFLPLATNLARYAQSAEELGLLGHVGEAKLPPGVPRIGSPSGSFEQDHASIEFGGGFYHYGYFLKLDTEATNAIRSTWELYLSREEQAPKSLHRLEISPTTKISRAEFISNTLANYNRRITEEPNEIRWPKDKLRFLSQYRPGEMAGACSNALRTFPEHWWPRLTMSLLVHRSGNFREAERGLKSFAEAKPSYSRFGYLAYFYFITDHPHDGASAIEKAVSQPIVDLPDDDVNIECLGYTLGCLAFTNGECAATIRLCNALLPVNANGNYAKAALSALKAAAELKSSGVASEFNWNTDMGPFDPYEKFNMEALLPNSPHP